MAELLEHPLVSKVREYMDSPNHDAQCAELIEMLSSISVAADELERAIVDVPAAEIDRNRLRHDLGRLLNTQVAMWDALGYLPERKHPHELRQTFVRVMHDVGDSSRPSRSRLTTGSRQSSRTVSRACRRT